MHKVLFSVVLFFTWQKVLVVVDEISKREERVMEVVR